MHSFTSVMPGETTSCIGCHEGRTETTPNRYGNELFRKVVHGPDPITPIEGVPEVFDYIRDIQPILDRHCTECHNPHRQDGNIVLTGGWAPLYTRSYMELGKRNIFGDNRNRAESDFEPYTIGSCASKLYEMIEEKHGEAELSDQEKNIVRCWLEAGANYAGTYASNACGQIGWYYIGLTNAMMRLAETAAMLKRSTAVATTVTDRKIDGKTGIYFIPCPDSRDFISRRLCQGYCL